MYLCFVKIKTRNIITFFFAFIFTLSSVGFNFYIHQCSSPGHISSFLSKSDIDCESQCTSHSCCHHNHDEKAEGSVSFHCCSDYHKYISLADFFIPSKAVFLSCISTNIFFFYSFDSFVKPEFVKKAFEYYSPPPKINISLNIFFSQFRN
ncbi:MAG: hypothetical protein A2275_17510 [Bacteroidetes bacterium RIFOXYA12_FULL_35_11]|nr:MAG: hypothetical protein A2275_17510 [Bacteroidetes bacterium RIFOXYA12_FULL_35_11]